MEFRVSLSPVTPSCEISIVNKPYGAWYVYIRSRAEYFRIDRRAKKLRWYCSEALRNCGHDSVKGMLFVPCVYMDNYLQIYDVPVLGYVAVYNGHICLLAEVHDEVSKIIYEDKKNDGKKMRFATVQAKVSEDKLYEIIPSLIADDPWLIKTVDNEIKLEQRLCEHLLKGNYPGKYVDYFIRAVKRYSKMGRGMWFLEKWRRLRYDLEKLLNNREVLEGLVE